MHLQYQLRMGHFMGILAKDNKQHGWLSNFLTIIGCIVLFVVILAIPDGKQETTKALSFSDSASVSTICELATLKSFYHNVVTYEEQPEGINRTINALISFPFGDISKIGYKKYWMEYSGIIETGIDASQIQINGPDEAGVVEVYVPDAKVLSAFADEDSFTEPLAETGWFTTISGKDKAEAFAKTQTIMRQEAEQDQTMLMRAKENAKLLLQKFIVNTGKEIGAKLSIQWISEPKR